VFEVWAVGSKFLGVGFQVWVFQRSTEAIRLTKRRAGFMDDGFQRGKTTSWSRWMHNGHEGAQAVSPRGGLLRILQDAPPRGGLPKGRGRGWGCGDETSTKFLSGGSARERL
jgi:hypothetical protein